MSATRWIIEGTFEAVTPVAIHTGTEEEAWPEGAPKKEPNDLPSVADSKRDLDVPVAGIELDHLSRPYLPATALKGMLRARAASGIEGVGDKAILRLFGDLPRLADGSAGDTTQSGLGGLADFQNAYFATDEAPTWRPALRGKTAIHEGSRTAEDGQLRHDRVVAPTTHFSGKILLCGADEVDVALLLALLDLVDGENAASAVGAATSQGDGRLRWHLGQVRRFGSAEAIAWMQAGAESRWTDHASKVDVAPLRIFSIAGQRIVLPLTLQIEGHFLVGAQGSYTNDEGKTATRRRPFRVSGDDTTTARLPGASLDGALRAQARRIYRTICGDVDPWPENDIDLPPAFERLFGSASHASLLECETFVCEDCTSVLQEFVAIDRFSGGAADDKKFAIEAFEAPILAGRIVLNVRRDSVLALSGKQKLAPALSISPAALGLAALVLKDLASSDIPLGAGTRKGYGAVGRLGFGAGGWSDMLRHLGSQVAELAPIVDELQPLAGLDEVHILEVAVDCLVAEAAQWSERRRSWKGAMA